ncbi:MAG: site-2 protease family protein [Opitutaceae bacterium]
MLLKQAQRRSHCNPAVGAQSEVATGSRKPENFPMLPSRSGSLPLFRLFGVRVYLHWWWFVFAAFELALRSRAYASYAWNVAEYLALFAIVLLHEYGNALACRQTGGKADEIILWPLGGVACVRPPPRPGAELWSIAAGPLVNVVLVPVILGLIRARTGLGWGAGSADYRHFLQALFWMNAGLLAFNVLPVYPLDGGQILRSLLWFRVGRARSLQIATILGIAGVVVLAGGLLWLQPQRWLFTLLLAGFLASQCLAGLRHARLILALEKLPRHAGFRCPSCQQAPPGGPLWSCPTCGNGFDPFSTGGMCPHCAAPRSEIPCPHCGTGSPPAAWGASRSSPIIDV